MYLPLVVPSVPECSFTDARVQVVEELGEGADQNQLHVVLGKLAASTERMNDDVAYLVIGAKTMISETLLHDLCPDVFS